MTILIEITIPILNEEARLMGTATDGLITTRQIDPITLERMKPSYCYIFVAGGISVNNLLLIHVVMF